MLLSVVIPFYQVEKYIGDCLALAAEISDCELLLVDDCGSDASAQIAADFCRTHANARIIRREKNGGLSAARNTGFAQAQGEYVYFLDSDDLLQPDALMALVREAHAKELDVAKARFVYFDDASGAETAGPDIEWTDVTTGGELFAAQCRAGKYEPMVWQCVYRRSFLEAHALTMAEGLLFEDELFQAPALLCAQRAAAYEMEILLYRQRAGSIMGSFAKSSRWCESYLEVCRRLSALAQELDDGEAKRALKKRVGQIALSTAKNIAAYGLPETIAKEALDFGKEHRSELSGDAQAAPDPRALFDGIMSEPAEFADEKLDSELAWRYPDELSTKKPLKLTVSGLLRELEGPEALPEMIERPAFMQEESEKTMTGAERGTAYHRAIQLLDFMQLKSLEGRALVDAIRISLDEFERRRLMTPVQREAVRPSMLAKFLDGEVGRRLRNADEVRKEWSFNVMLRTEEALTEAEVGRFAGEELLVQGTVDCCFLEDGAWVLLDYKTDRSRDIEALKAHYQNQLRVYALALERITGIPVRQKILCLLAADVVVEV